MTTRHSSIHLASEGSFDTISTDSLEEMRSLVAEYADDPNGAVLDGWEPREGTIVTEVRAISARINQNYDAWPSDELREAHHTFIGKPVFVNHNNHDPDRARGRVVASRYVDAGEEDRYVQVLQEVEASRFPLLAKELMEGGLDSVSMGAEAREVECSFCANISTSPWDACEHIPLKGSTLQRRTASGQPEDVLVYEVCRKISFFELSYVFDPADETAVASNVLVANHRESLNEVEAPPKVDTLHPEEDEKSSDDWHEYIDDPNVIDTIDVLDEPDLGLNQELERPDDEIPEGFEEFADVDEQIEENEKAEQELAQDSREHAQDKADSEAEKAQEQFEQESASEDNDSDKDPEDDENWEDEDDGAGSKSQRFKGGPVEAMVADDYGTFNMWVEKNGQLIASDSYASFKEAKTAAVSAAKKHLSEWGGYSDWEDCKQQNSNAESSDAYCGEIKHRVEKGRERKMSRIARRRQAYDDRPPQFDVGDKVLWNDNEDEEATVVQVDEDEDETIVWVKWPNGQEEETTAYNLTHASHKARRKQSQTGQFQEVPSHSEGFGNSRVWVYWPMFASGRGLVVEEDPSTVMWMIEDASGRFTKTEFADSIQEAQQEVDNYYHTLGSRKARRKQADIHEERSDAADRAASWAEGKGVSDPWAFASWIVDTQGTKKIDESVFEVLLNQFEGNSNGGYQDGAYYANRKQADYGPDDYPTVQDAFGAFLADHGIGIDEMDDAGGAWASFEPQAAAAGWTWEELDIDFSTLDIEASRRNGARRTSYTNNRDISRRSNRMAPQRRRRIGDNKQTPLLEETGIAQTPAEEPVALPEEGDSHPNNSESDRVQTARRRLALELARERALKARRRRAKAVGENLSGASVDREDLFQDYPATNMTARLRKRFANWVSDNYGSSLRQASGPGELRSWARVFSKEAGIELPRLHAAIKRDVMALRVAKDDEGPKGDEADSDNIPDFIEEKIESDEDNPSNDDADEAKKESRHRAARRRVARKYSVGDRVKLTGESREGTVSWVSSFGDVVTIKFDGGKEETVNSSAVLPANPVASRSARRQAQARNARGRRTHTTRRRTADDKLDVAAPGDRVNVEKPTSGTTDDEAEASQFNRSDFDNNSGKGLENPDTTGTPGIPGGPSVNDLKKSTRASGLQAVQLAEAMIAANLIEDTREAKFKAAAQFEKMSRDIVLDRTALLEKVVTANAKRRPSNQKSAGNRGASLSSAVPPNMTGMTRSSAPQRREASSDNDSDLFF